MKLNKRIAIMLSLVALIAVGAVFAVAQTQGGGRRHHWSGADGTPRFLERMLGRASAYLNLTEQQEAQIKAIIEAEKPKAAPLLAELKANREALDAATANGAFNEAQVRELAAKQAQTLAALLVEKERVQSQVYAVLTPEQRAKAEQFRSRMKERIQRHFTE